MANVIAIQIDGKIKLTWEYAPSFWLDFEPEYMADKTFETNEVTMPCDCDLFIDCSMIVTGPAVLADLSWVINDGSKIRVISNGSWVSSERIQSLQQGDKLKLSARAMISPYPPGANVGGTITLYRNDIDGDKVAEFDYLLQ